MRHAVALKPKTWWPNYVSFAKIFQEAHTWIDSLS